jgi:hypothetical protein
MRSIVVVGLLLLASGATAAHHEAEAEASGIVVQVVSTVVGGKNVFVPSTIVVAEGEPHTLSIYNTTEKPHGFSIPALGIEMVLVEGMETEVKIPALEGNRILSIHCQLHPAHRTATLVALDTD